MSRISVMQELLKAEQLKREEDLLNTGNIVQLIKNLELKLDQKFDEINPKSQYRLLNIHDVMDLVDQGDKWITEHIAAGTFPPAKVFGGKRKWYQKDIERWIRDMMESTEH
ncbi:hypothetical protein MMG00_01945 [Ignatzschineria rhizosphaerae]|uniref:DNA-binding protein n=1 Tax=Ignatzschineria rhizosphaerae TaxID=2923279 RepID=A0ABY3X4L7_9GAMM|nr:hypothetical protein [Ignatzschineria rhizosphaerae]UNM96649.1 hypothetical protein MMG00_01945 [Ignatzschineria rhizosphaerae]